MLNQQIRELLVRSNHWSVVVSTVPEDAWDANSIEYNIYLKCNSIANRIMVYPW